MDINLNEISQTINEKLQAVNQWVESHAPEAVHFIQEHPVTGIVIAVAAGFFGFMALSIVTTLLPLPLVAPALNFAGKAALAAGILWVSQYGLTTIANNAERQGEVHRPAAPQPEAPQARRRGRFGFNFL